MAKRKGVYGKTIVGIPGKLQFPVLDKPLGTPMNLSDLSFSAHLICIESPKLQELLNEITAVKLKAFGPEDNPILRMPQETGNALIARLIADGKELTESSRQLYEGRLTVRLKSKGDKEPPKCYVGKALMPRRPGNEDDLRNIREQFYAGSFVRIAATPFSYAMSAQVQGVSLVLKAIQFVKDGDRIGGINMDEAMSEEFTDEGFFDDEGFEPDTGTIDSDDIPF